MLCNELMKKDVLFANANAPVGEAAVIMRDSNVGFLPVCDLSSGEILGTITDRDIAIRLVANGMPASIAAGEIATPATFFCWANAEVEEAREIMRENRIARVMCVDDKGRLAGVLSLSDIANRMPELAAETLRELSHRDVETLDDLEKE
jgi:CBS domain-containing protein